MASGGTLDLAGYSTGIGSLSGAGIVTNTNATAATITAGANGTTTSFSGIIRNGTGAVSFAKAGSGVLTLSGSNTYTGTTTVNGGTLAAGSTSAFGTNSAVTVASGATLDLGGYSITIGSLAGAGVVTNSNAAAATLTAGNNGVATSFSGIIRNGSGTVALTKEGNGTLTLLGDNTFSGGMNITAGRISIGDADSLGAAGSAIAIAAGAGLDIKVTTANNITYSHVWSGAGDLTYTSADNGTGSPNTIAGDGSNFRGTITTSGAGKTAFSGIDFSNAVVTTNAASTIITNGGTVAFGSLSGSGSVRSGGLTTGTAGLTIGNLNTDTTYSGILTQYDASAPLAITKVGSGTLTLSGTNNNSGTTTIKGGTLQVLNTNASGATGKLGSGAVSIDSGAALVFTNSSTTNDAYIVSNVISGAGSLRFNGPDAAITTLTGASSYSGGTTISSGIVNVGANTALGTGRVTMTGGALTTTTGTRTLANAFTLSGTIGWGANINASGAIQLAGDTALTASRNAGNSTLSGAVALDNFTFGTIDTGPNTAGGSWSGQTLTISGAISGLGGIAQSGAGVLLLSGVNTYTGATGAIAGKLLAGSTSAFGNQSALTLGSGATLDLGGYNNSVGSLAGAGTVTNTGAAGAVLTAGSSNTSTTFSGAIRDGTGTVSFTKAGTGTQTLSGANSYTGDTTVNAGVIDLTGSLDVGTRTANVAVMSGASIRGSGVVTAGTFAASGAGTFSLTGANKIAAINGSGTIGSLALNNTTALTIGSISASGAISISNSAVTTIMAGRVIDAKGNIQISATGNATLTNSGVVNQTGTGSILLSTVNGMLTNAGSITGGASAGAITLQTTGSGAIDGAAGTIDQAGAGAIRITADGTGAVTSGVVRLTSATASTLTISGKNTVTVGRDITSTGGALATSISGGQLQLGANITTRDGNLSLTGPVTQTGNSSLVAGTGKIDFGGTVDGGYNLTASAATINASAGWGATNRLGRVSLTTSNSLSLPSISAASILAQSTGGNLVIASGSVLNAAATNDAVVLAAGGNFINNRGADAITTPNGRWLVFSTRPESDTFGNLDSANTAIWNTTYASSGGTISQNGNRYVFAKQQTLTVSSQSMSKTYGDDVRSALASSYTVSGFDSGVLHAYLGDTAGSALSGAPAVTSNGAASSANAGSYAIDIAQGTLNALNGYTLAYGASGTLTVNKAGLTVTALGAGKTYDGQAWRGGNGVSYSGFVQGEGAGDLGGSLTYGGLAQGALNAGSYTLTAAGLTSGNYDIAYVDGALTIGKAGLTVTALGAGKTYDGQAWRGGNGVSYSGFVQGEGAGDLGGSLTYGGLAQGALNAGSYTLTAAGLTSGNYDIRYIDGALTVARRQIIVTPNSIIRNAATPNPLLGYTVGGMGLVVGDSLSGALETKAQTLSPPGRYTIERGTLSANNNYDLKFVAGDLLVTGWLFDRDSLPDRLLRQPVGIEIPDIFDFGGTLDCRARHSAATLQWDRADGAAPSLCAR